MLETVARIENRAAFLPNARQDWLEIVDNIPLAGTLTLGGRTWQDYEELLAAVGEAGHLRISFDCGTLKIMTLTVTHEKFERLLQSLIAVLNLRLNVDIASVGSATMREKKKGKGAEPDCSFYVGDTERIASFERLNLDEMPAPDIVFEVDIYHNSDDKFSIYAAFGIGEFWVYDGEDFAIYILENNVYAAQENSKHLPVLTATKLAELMNARQEKKESEILREFDRWLAEQSESK